MATATKVTRVANPRRTRKRRTRTNGKRMVRNRSGQFVRKARTVKRRRATNRVHKRVTRRVNRRKRNPVLIELGAINPFRGTRKRRKSMATRKRRKSRNPRRRRHVTAVAPVRRRRRRRVNSSRRRVYRRRRNPVAVTHRRRRRRSVGVSRRRNRRYSRRRNPEIFGRSGGKDLLMMVGGGLVGVAATKFLPTLIPASITASLGSSPIVGVGMTIAGAFAASWLAKKVSPSFGDAVLFGGLMQAGSVLLTAFAPAALSSQLALSGMGDIVPGMFVVPQNPVTNRPMLAASMSGGGGGMGAAIPRPFGRR
jgi:hypothetical protein